MRAVLWVLALAVGGVGVTVDRAPLGGALLGVGLCLSWLAGWISGRHDAAADLLAEADRLERERGRLVAAGVDPLDLVEVRRRRP